MKTLRCPRNGLRDIEAFRHLGPDRAEPDPGAASDAEWARRVFRSWGGTGVVRERWRRIPSSTVFLAERNLTTDEVLRTWLPGETP
jgi:sarcosine oxidase subunit delta